MNTLREMALAGIKEGRRSSYKTTCLLIIIILFSVSCQSDKLEVVSVIYSVHTPLKYSFVFYHYQLCFVTPLLDCQRQ